jgi:hypothetical protein
LVATVEVYAAGPEALERRDRGIEAMQRFVEDGLEHFPRAPARRIAGEGIVSALYALLCDRVRSRGTAGLRDLAPLATYMFLVPFLGPERACEVANGGGGADADSRLPKP